MAYWFMRGANGGKPTWGPARAAGTAFVELRRDDAIGIQPTLTDEHDMEVFISKGLVGFTWDADGTRHTASGITNPFWVRGQPLAPCAWSPCRRFRRRTGLCSFYPPSWTRTV